MSKEKFFTNPIQKLSFSFLVIHILLIILFSLLFIITERKMITHFYQWLTLIINSSIYGLLIIIGLIYLWFLWIFEKNKK